MAAEEVRYWNALRADYHPIVELYFISGRRRSDWVGLLKSKCQLAAGTVRLPIRKKKKQGEMTVTLTEREHEIISEEMAKSPASCPLGFHLRGPARRAAPQERRSHRHHRDRATPGAWDGLEAVGCRRL